MIATTKITTSLLPLTVQPSASSFNLLSLYTGSYYNQQNFELASLGDATQPAFFERHFVVRLNKTKTGPEKVYIENEQDAVKRRGFLFDAANYIKINLKLLANKNPEFKDYSKNIDLLMQKIGDPATSQNYNDMVMLARYLQIISHKSDFQMKFGNPDLKENNYRRVQIPA